MAELQCGKGRVMIDSVIRAQSINVTDRQTPTQPRRDSIAFGQQNIIDVVVRCDNDCYVLALQSYTTVVALFCLHCA